MKKTKWLSLILGISVMLTACSNSSGGGSGSGSGSGTNDPEIIPDTPIDRNVELKNIQVQAIELDKEYDLSEYAGKKVFLVYQNDTDEDIDVFVNQTSSSMAEPDLVNELIKASGHYYSVPYNPPELPFEYVKASPYSINANRSAARSVAEPSIGDKRDFYGYDKNNIIDVNLAKGAVLKAIGEHCYVWYVAKNGIKVTDAMLNTLADTFDSIFEKETYLFGSNIPDIRYNNIIDVDEDTKIDIIVYDLFGDVETTKKNGGGIMGYFTSLDFQNQDQEYQGKIYYSNKSECLHMDSYFLEVSTEGQRSTIAHEFQHLLHFVNKNLNNNQEAKTWFNEMMSMTCEDIMQSQLGVKNEESPKARLSTFNCNHNLGFTTWRDRDSDGEYDVYASYANAYAFGAYLVRNYGIDFIKELAHNEYVDEAAITEALVAVDAPEKTFDEAYDKYYNVILNPKATSYTLNKAVEKTYNDIAGNKTVKFECSAINLFDYLAVNFKYMTEDEYPHFYQGSKYNNYYGPIVWDNGYFWLKVGPKGTGISHIDISTNTKAKLPSARFSSKLSYFVAIAE